MKSISPIEEVYRIDYQTLIGIGFTRTICHITINSCEWITCNDEARLQCIQFTHVTFPSNNLFNVFLLLLLCRCGCWLYFFLRMHMAHTQNGKYKLNFHRCDRLGLAWLRRVHRCSMEIFDELAYRISWRFSSGSSGECAKPHRAGEFEERRYRFVDVFKIARIAMERVVFAVPI